jgi:hypothetical protein
VRHALRAGLLAFCLGAGLTACDSGGGEEARRTGASAQLTPKGKVTIESSLDGLAILPPRIRWSATTSLPPEDVRGVRFIVDSDRWWGDTEPPYTFCPDGAYLATRWISSLSKPARVHSFQVRVFATNGESWSETVRVRLPRPIVARNSPGVFRGYRSYFGYGRLSAEDLAHPPSPGTWPTYRGRIAFVGASVFVTVEEGQFAWELSSDRERVYIGTPIFLDRHAEPGRPAGYKGLEDVLCATDGPPAVYSWSHMKGRLLSRYRGEEYYANYVRLSAVKEPCTQRRRVLEGVWDEITD